MKLVRIYDYGGPEQLKLEEAERPEPGPGQLRIRVLASSVNPGDWKLCSGAARAIVPLSMPAVLGGDIAGVVDAVGPGVTGWQPGDAVFALIGLVGAYADYVVTEAGFVAPKPKDLNFAEAACLPLAALTAWQGFAQDGRDLAGLTVLVHNAAGGVGSVAVQIAKARGARVIATASAKNATFLRDLGADEVVDFRLTPAAGRAREVDLLLDLVGDAGAMALWSLVRPGGSVIRVAGGADAPKQAEAGGIRVIKLRVQPNGGQLAEIAKLAERGALRPVVSAIFPLRSVGEAHALSQTGHVRGKIALTLDP